MALGWFRWRAWVGFGAVVAAAVCVAGVALRDIDLHFAWQAWHFLRHGCAFCVAGVALMALGWFRWRAWVGFGAVVAAAVCVAGVALRDIDLDFAWQAWHFVTSTFVLRGRCRTCGTGLAPTPSLTHQFVTHHLSDTIFHTHLCHTPSLTHHFVTHHLSHTTLSHHLCHTHHLSHTQLCHTPLCHTPSFTHNFVIPSLSHTTFTHTHYLSHTTLPHTIFDTPLVTHHLSHTIFHTHTIFVTPLCHTPSLTHHLSLHL